MHPVNKTFTKESVADLEKRVQGLREDLRKFRFAMTGTRAKNVREGVTLRKEIARIMTELRARALNSVSAKS